MRNWLKKERTDGTSGGLTKQDKIILFTFSARASRSLALNSFNFDMLNAISFQLGCLYSGQTAVAFGKLMGGTSLLMRLISGSWGFVALSHHQVTGTQGENSSPLFFACGRSFSPAKLCPVKLRQARLAPVISVL